MSHSKLGKSEIANKLQTLRKEANLTIAELGKMANIDPSSISRIERGLQRPSLITVFSLLNAMHVSLTEFINDFLGDRVGSDFGQNLPINDEDVLMVDSESLTINQLNFLLDVASSIRKNIGTNEVADE